MTFSALLTQTVTLVRTTTETRDTIGGSTFATTTQNVSGYLEPTGCDEDLADRGTQIGDWRLFLDGDVDVTGWDRVTYDGHTFEIVGPPMPFASPVTNHTHQELRLQEVV